jgi:hypothetical protein
MIYAYLNAARRTGSKTDVVEGELADSWVELQEQRQRLTDTTSGTENGDLGVLMYLLVSNASPTTNCHVAALATKAIGVRRRYLPGGQWSRRCGARPGRKLAWQRT